jgi:hypothetical protein
MKLRRTRKLFEHPAVAYDRERPRLLVDGVWRLHRGRDQAFERRLTNRLAGIFANGAPKIASLSCILVLSAPLSYSNAASLVVTRPQFETMSRLSITSLTPGAAQAVARAACRWAHEWTRPLRMIVSPCAET